MTWHYGVAARWWTEFNRSGPEINLLLVLVALRIRALGANPRLVDAWRSPQVAWLGRAALLAGATVSGMRLVSDTAQILG